MNRMPKTTEELIHILIGGYTGENYVISSDDVKIPEHIEKNIRDDFEFLKQANLIRNYSIWITGGWELSIYPSLLSYFDNVKTNDAPTTNNSNYFYGDLTGVQIQQGTTYSTQEQTFNNGFDYEAVKAVIEQIKKYDLMLDDEFGDNAVKFRTKMTELEILVKEKNDSNKIKVLLTDIKNLAVGVGGSLIASGIVSLIGGVI